MNMQLALGLKAHFLTIIVIMGLTPKDTETLVDDFLELLAFVHSMTTGRFLGYEN